MSRAIELHRVDRRANDDQALAIERVTKIRLVRVVVACVAITNPGDVTGTFDFEGYEIVSGWDEAAFRGQGRPF